jgi:hypothetical protein
MGTQLSGTTPEQPVSVVSSVVKDITWLKTHLILLVIVIVLVVGSVYSIDSIIAKHDAANSTKDSVALQQQTAQTDMLLTKFQQFEQVSAQQNAQLTAMNAQLSNYITQRDKALVPVLQKDTTLSAVDAAQKITLQTKSQPGEVVAQGDIVQMDLSASRIVVANQDQLPIVQADLADAKTEIRQGETVIENLQTNVSDGTKVIDSMKIEAADAAKKCSDDIATVKSNARKSKIKWILGTLAVALEIGRYI